MGLTIDQARSLYDRIGRAQDWQAFYEDRTTERLLAAAAITGHDSIFEFGCGTGRLAARMLGGLPAPGRYLGVDLSPVMVDLAAGRVAPWADRAEVTLVHGSLPLPAADDSADLAVSTFVFDLLDQEYAQAVLKDLRRILTPGGRLCLASLTPGSSLLQRSLSRAWTTLWRVAPRLVGGCRPITLAPLLGTDWRVQHHSRVHNFGLVTEVVVAVPEMPPS